MAFSQSILTRFHIDGVSKVPSRVSRLNVRCQASQEDTSRRQLLGVGLIFAASVFSPSARADIIEDLKTKSEANKALNDQKRLATSGANFARSRTMADGTCQFPNNFFGCDVESIAGKVKYISDDIELECSGNEKGTCAEVPDMFDVGP